MNAFRLHSIIGLFLFQLTACALAADMRDRPFDSDWRFFRGDASGAQNPAFDDSQWRKLDLPHDWSIEDLPPRTNAVPALAIVDGEWRFQPGDDANWKASDFNDSHWQRVQLPDNWERHSNHTNENVYG